jgi:hypothetical protein
LRKFLRKGPHNNASEPYDGAILRGKFTPFVTTRFKESHISTLRQSDLPSYLAGKTFILPEHVWEMLRIMEDKDTVVKNKLKLVYQLCNEAVENKSASRSSKTHHHYTASRGFIEIMVDPLYRDTYQKIISTEFRLPEGFLEALQNKLLLGPNNDRANPYKVGILGGITIQTDPNTSVTVTRHADDLLCEIDDVLPDDSKKAKRIFFSLVDAVVSYNLGRDDSTQQCYEALLKDFSTQINAIGNDARSDSEHVQRL